MYMESRKIVLMKLSEGQQWVCRHKELVDTVREGEYRTNWESSIETYTLPYVKLDSQWKFAIWHRDLKSGALW